MCYFLWYFGREEKALRSLGTPGAHNAHSRSSIESGVNLYGVEVLRVIGQIVGGFQVLRIKRSGPASRGKGGRSYANGWIFHQDDLVSPNPSGVRPERSMAADWVFAISWAPIRIFPRHFHPYLCTERLCDRTSRRWT